MHDETGNSINTVLAARRCYLLAFEIASMKVGGIYEVLPQHCTLIHRFWANLASEELAEKLRPLFNRTKPIALSARKRLVLGPKRVVVSEIEFTEELRTLHRQLYVLLNSLKVEYTELGWVGDGYRAHATDREHAKLEVGSSRLGKAVYLIEVKVPGHEHKRAVREKFALAG